ncbi:MAG: zf-HC2 domain-containing protein [Actinomycetota bacterium]
MNCTAVRDRLTDRALGAVPADDGQALDRHLAWCAACRKEAGELDRAAATFAFALAPAEPAPDLEDRVVENVQAVATKRPLPVARRGRLAVTLAVAGMLAVSGLGWGAVMAGRAARFEDLTRAARQGQQDAIALFREEVLNSAEFKDPDNEVFLGTLESDTRGATAAGSALTLVSPTIPDIAIVMVNGFEATAAKGALPFRVFLTGEGGRRLRVGRIKALDTGGGAILSTQFEVDLSRYVGVEVRDKDGNLVLHGSVSPRPSITTPSP